MNKYIGMVLGLGLLLALPVGEARAQDLGDPEFIVHVPVNIPALHENVADFIVKCNVRDANGDTLDSGWSTLRSATLTPYDGIIVVEIQVPSISWGVADPLDVASIECRLRVHEPNSPAFLVVENSEDFAVQNWRRAAPDTPFSGTVTYTLP